MDLKGVTSVCVLVFGIGMIIIGLALGIYFISVDQVTGCEEYYATLSSIQNIDAVLGPEVDQWPDGAKEHYGELLVRLMSLEGECK